MSGAIGALVAAGVALLIPGTSWIQVAGSVCIGTAIALYVDE